MNICYFTSGVFPVSKTTVKAVENWTYHLATEMAKKGHNIHLFASENSRTKFHLHKPKTGKIPYEQLKDQSHYTAYLSEFFSDCVDFANKNSIDIIHDQTAEPYVMNLARYCKKPVVSSLHIVFDDPDLKKFYQICRYTKNVAPTKFLAKKSQPLKSTVVHHGVDENVFKFDPKGGTDFLSLGRIVPGKGVLEAIKAAKIAKINLRVAGYQSIYDSDDNYFQEVVYECKQSNNLKFIGKVERKDVPKVMGASKGFILPLEWGEPFGIVMIEAMASGTPVIAYECGPVPEIIKDGVNGILIKKGDVKGLAKAMKDIDKIDRKKCREMFLKKFTLKKMADNYEKLYRSLMR